MRQEKYSLEEDFVKNADIFRVVEHLYDHSLQQKNEVLFIRRVLKRMAQETDKPENTLEYQTLLFYISKYGFFPETELLMLRSVSADRSENSETLSLFPELVCGLIGEYARRRDFCEEGQALAEELQRTGRVPYPVPEYSDEKKVYFNRRYIREYTGYIRFIGICVID